jgi:hypothetical protein
MGERAEYSVTIIGRRWFDRRAGNTYFSAVGLIDGVEVASIDYEYGYGDQYEQSMFDLLISGGFIPEGEKLSRPSDHCRALGLAYFATVADVARKGDL